MAQTIKPITPTVAGAVAVKTLCTAETILITNTTAQSALDLSKLVVFIENATSVASVISTSVGEDFSEIGQGAKTLTTLGTSGSATGNIIVGGKSFESARFQDNDGNISLVIATTASSVYITAFMLP